MMRIRTICSILVLLVAVGAAFAQEPPKPEPTPAPAPAPAAAPAPAMAAPAAAPMVKSIKIVVDDKANTDGEIRFDFVPSAGEAKQVRVTVAKKMKANDVTKDIEKEFKIALGADYKVDRYDADKVQIEAKKKDATFRLTIASLTANGLSVRLK
jgi:hypothetical protein